MKKAAPQIKKPSTPPIKKKPLPKKVQEEPLAEGFIQEPHADYGLLNNEIDKDNVKK